MIAKIAAYAATRVDNVTVAVEDNRTGQIFQYRPGVVEHTASTLKVDILATLLSQAQAAGRALTPAEQALAVPMIEESLDSAADTLWGQLGPAPVAAFERAAGMTETTPATDGVWGTTTTTALDRLAMIRTLAQPNALLTDASRAYVLNLMEHITPTQDWGATGGVPTRRHRGVEERLCRDQRLADQHDRVGGRRRAQLLDRRAHRRQPDRGLRHRHRQRHLVHRVAVTHSLSRAGCLPARPPAGIGLVPHAHRRLHPPPGPLTNTECGPDECAGRDAERGPRRQRPGEEHDDRTLHRDRGPTNLRSEVGEPLVETPQGVARS